MKNGWLCLLLLVAYLPVNAQSYELKSTTQIYRDLQEMQRGLRVLYLAAHPDDENTRLISWLENAEHVQMAYLSLTRGQGGQNLIGDEKGDALGVIRSYELLAARSVDGGQQFFTRAIDFGYSKSAEESFEFWGKEEVLHDVVYVIRKYRPHIIINRFPPTRRAGHGHHEASAILAEEAFDLAADESAFPDQLKHVETWKPEALYFNTSSWWDKSLEDMSDEALAEQKMLRVNIGVYNDLLGKGMNEIASLARSKHRCQAFGTPRRRGEQMEYLQFVKGEWNEEFIDSEPGMWEQSPEHAEALQHVLDEFDFTDRWNNYKTFQKHFTPKLIQRNMWAAPKDMEEVYRRVNQLKLDLSGIRVEVYSSEDPAVICTSFPVTIEVYNSADQEREITFKHSFIDTSFTIAAGARVEWTKSFVAPLEPSNPFWLERDHVGWLYGIEKDKNLGMAVRPDELIPFFIELDGQKVMGESLLHRKWNDRSVGEVLEKAAFVHPVSVNPQIRSLVMKKGSTQELEVQIVANQDVENIQLQLTPPLSGWQITHDQASFSMKKGQVRSVTVEVKAEQGAEEGRLNFSVMVDRSPSDQMTTTIDYEHIPFVILHDHSATELIPLDINNDNSKSILYIDGSGDEVDDALRLLGYEVDNRSINGITLEELNTYDAVVTGIRAFNRNDELAANIDMLQAYVMNGGTMLVQYNTTYDLNVDQIGPYPLELSRNRVTDEYAEVEILEPNHPVFNRPNTISSADWTDWVQERGLYFAGEWDKNYTPLISWSDKGEEPAKGGLLVAEYGKGYFVYTGISFFRQLPAGVPGAFRLLTNLVELEHD